MIIEALNIPDMVIKRSYSLTLCTSNGIGHNITYPSEHIIPNFWRQNYNAKEGK
jgi:hypothetical protein